MKIRNSNTIDTFKCHEKSTHDFLLSYSNIVHINKGTDEKGDFWVYLKTKQLKVALEEYDAFVRR